MAQNKFRLSHRERTARTKIIQELHYKKNEQYLLDQYVSASHKTYRGIHKEIEEGRVLLFMAEIGAKRLAEAFARASFTAEAASSALREVFMKISERSNYHGEM